MSIASLDQLAFASKQILSVVKTGVTAKAAGTPTSMWAGAGWPSAGAAPGAANIPTSATTGALPFFNPSGGALTYLQQFSGSSSIVGLLVLYDRIAHMSGLSGTVTTAQTVNTPAITRGTGAGVELWLEWYTTTGGTAANVTASYTNSAGVSGRSTTAVSVVAGTSAGSMLRLPLQAGDTGVNSVQSVTLSASTGTAGNFGVTLVRPLGTAVFSATNIPVSIDTLACGLVNIPDNACLAMYYIPNTTTAPSVSGFFTLAQG